MKANGRFYRFSTIFNLVLGAIGFLILWAVRAISSEHIAGFIVCGALFTVFAAYVNLFIVKRSKLKIPYFIFGTLVNLVACAGLTALTMLL